MPAPSRSRADASRSRDPCTEIRWQRRQPSETGAYWARDFVAGSRARTACRATPGSRQLRQEDAVAAQRWRAARSLSASTKPFVARPLSSDALVRIDRHERGHSRADGRRGNPWRDAHPFFLARWRAAPLRSRSGREDLAGAVAAQRVHAVSSTASLALDRLRVDVWVTRWRMSSSTTINSKMPDAAR